LICVTRRVAIQFFRVFVFFIVFPYFQKSDRKWNRTRAEYLKRRHTSKMNDNNNQGTPTAAPINQGSSLARSSGIQTTLL
jgi:hypothetical protein